MTTWLISGTTRGIGKGLVEKLLQRPNTTVVAGVRNPEDKNAKALSELPKADGSKIIVVKIDSSIESDAAAAVAKIQELGISQLDVVIANAGIMYIEEFAPVTHVKFDWLRKSFEINTLGPIALFQATKPLLDKSENPKFVVTTSLLGSNVVMGNPPASGLPALVYGMSKAAVNFFISKAHGENANITFIPIHPGAVDTDMAAPLKAMNSEDIPIISLETSTAGILKVLDAATRESASGKYVDYEGQPVPF